MNNSYKKWHKPLSEEKSRTKQGYYKIQNPKKYMGDPNLIIYRSSWEFSFCKWCDFTPSVQKWSSEPLKIKYYDRISKLDELKKAGLDPNNPVNWKIRNYNLDFWVKVQKADDLIEEWFIEVKPKNKLFRPKPPKAEAKLKEVRRFNFQAKEFLINEAKFMAAKKWVSEREMQTGITSKFYIFTEDELKRLGILGGKFKYNG